MPASPPAPRAVLALAPVLGDALDDSGIADRRLEPRYLRGPQRFFR
ncbi:hypothetical protein ACFXKG_15215 [Streptomyces sp. NPDC059255]